MYLNDDFEVRINNNLYNVNVNYCNNECRYGCNCDIIINSIKLISDVLALDCEVDNKTFTMIETAVLDQIYDL